MSESKVFGQGFSSRSLERVNTHKQIAILRKLYANITSIGKCQIFLRMISFTSSHQNSALDFQQVLYDESLLTIFIEQESFTLWAEHLNELFISKFFIS
jgi:hypothetical protein